MAAPSFRVLTQYIGLFLLLVVLPGISWIYLKNGYDYQKKLRSELKDLGAVPAFHLPMTTGDTLTLDSLSDKVAIACFIDTREPINTPVKMQVIRQMMQQFHDQQLDFLIHTAHPETDSLTVLRAFAVAQQLDQSHQCKFLTGSSEQMRTLATSGYRLPEGFPARENPYFVLTARQIGRDSIATRQIKGYYNITLDADKRKMIEHTVMLLGLVDSKVRGR